MRKTIAVAALLGAVVLAGCAPARHETVRVAQSQTQPPQSPALANVATSSKAGAAGAAGAAPTPTSSGPPVVIVRPGAMVPAVSSVPAAGICPVVPGPIVTIATDPDVPTPRCVQIRADQRLEILNSSNGYGVRGLPVTVVFADYPARIIPVGESTLFNRPVGDLLAVGVQSVYFSAIRGTVCVSNTPAFCPGTGYGAELWLR
jgi:hypothetical protein